MTNKYDDKILLFNIKSLCELLSSSLLTFQHRPNFSLRPALSKPKGDFAYGGIMAHMLTMTTKRDQPTQ